MRTVLLALLVLVAGSAAAAGLPGFTDGVIQGCVRKDGVLMVVTAEQCRALAGQSLAWKIQGPKGDPGTKLTAIEDLNGLACTAGGDAGTISISTASGGAVSLKCSVNANGPVLRINEVMTASTISAASEFVEIVNTGLAPADLGGYRLVYRSTTGTSDETLATVPSGASVAPGSRYVFGGTTFWGTSNQTYNSGLASAGGGVGLRTPSGQLVDSVGYGSGTTNAFVETARAAAPRAGLTISRIPDGHDSNFNAADFSSTSPTPGAVNHP